MASGQCGPGVEGCAPGSSPHMPHCTWLSALMLTLLGHKKGPVDGPTSALASGQGKEAVSKDTAVQPA